MAVPDRIRRIVVPLADKIVYASNAYVSLKSTVNQLGDQLIDFTTPVSGGEDARLREAAALIRPMTGDDLSLVRVGGDRDGGYVMASDFAAVGAVSVGVGPDVSWDQDVARRGLRVSMFDPTVRKLPQPVPGGQFFKVGIGGSTRTEEFRPLRDLVLMAGFGAQDELILKIDVEGAEYPSLEWLSPDDLNQFRQIAIELHRLADLADPMAAESILNTLRVLAAGHVPVHVHANNYDDLVRFDRNWFPNAVEVSYVRRDLLQNPRPAVEVASGWDRPCDPRVPEIPLEALTRL
jgi:hypothetical protein